MPDASQILLCDQCGLPLPPRKRRRKRDSTLDLYCCYSCYLTHTLLGAKGEEGTRTLLLARLGLSAFLAMNAMTFTWALYGQDLPIFFPVDKSTRSALSYLIFALSVPVFLLIGIPYLRSTFEQVRRLSIGVDTLIALGTSSAFVVSVISTFTGGSDIYFDTATMVLVLVTFGRYLESTAKLKASKAVEELLEKQPAKARILRGHQEWITDISDVRTGDIVKILPGERIPVDGKIVDGKSSVDESILTGEPRPLAREPGDRVFGGALNHDGYILIEAAGPADTTILSQITRMVQEAQTARSRTQETADRLSAFFVPIVICLAAVTTLIWSVHAGAAVGLLNGLSVLLIACPCGLGVGIALPASLAMSRAAKNGVLIRSFSDLESLARSRMVLFDKTGTLTSGRFTVEEVHLATGSRLTDDQAVAIAASLEDRSGHPLGQALMGLAAARGLSLFPVRHAVVTPGVGVEGMVECSLCDGAVVEIARTSDGNNTDDQCEPQDVSSGCTQSYLMIDKSFQAVFLMKDTLRPEAKEAIDDLRSLGIAPGIVSGDRREAVDAVATALNVDFVYSDLVPGEKSGLVQREQNLKRGVVMVGDGLNDAPALASADVGIAFGSSTDLAKQSSDVTIMDTDLRKVPWIIGLSRRVLHIIRWNLIWAFSYNLVGIGLAVGGVLRPIHAALAMVLSSALVIVNSLRLAAPDRGIKQGTIKDSG